MTWTSATAPRSIASPASSAPPSSTTCTTPTTWCRCGSSCPRSSSPTSATTAARRAPTATATPTSATASRHTDVIDMSSRRGLHRKVDDGAVKARLVAAAMAAGATAAAAYSVVNATDTAPAETDGRRGPDRLRRRRRDHRFRRRHADRHGRPGRQRRRAQRGTRQRCRLRRRSAPSARRGWPGRCSSCPTKGVWTSGFGYRWGVLHARHRHRQLDRHADLAAADGVVTDAGPTAGYGAWVKIRHADGTVTCTATSTPGSSAPASA